MFRTQGQRLCAVLTLIVLLVSVAATIACVADGESVWTAVRGVVLFVGVLVFLFGVAFAAAWWIGEGE